MKQILCLIILLLGESASAQVKTNFNNKDRIDESGKFKKNFFDKPPFVIPAIDHKTLIAKEALIF